MDFYCGRKPSIRGGVFLSYKTFFRNSLILPAKEACFYPPILFLRKNLIGQCSFLKSNYNNVPFESPIVLSGRDFFDLFRHKRPG